ncbi:MAG: septum formation inhibitor Maf [Xanthomonadaceae bacterium]|jgi:septum formation protein|nr:septum formation inhibitor Maf [Xanthomonadaceae bacterium]
MLMLASRSPRRLDLLRQLGLDPECLDVEVAERRQPGEPALDYVHRVAREKAGAGLLAAASRPDAVVLAADTEVILDGEVLGKPADAAEAAVLLRRLSGRRHEVATVVWVLSAAREGSARSVSTVDFAPLSEAAIAAYLASGEWRGKAGGYAIQGRAAAFIAHLSGSYSGVMGLPLFETAGLLRVHGVPV